VIGADEIAELLGRHEWRPEHLNEVNEVGVATGIVLHADGR